MYEPSKVVKWSQEDSGLLLITYTGSGASGDVCLASNDAQRLTDVVRNTPRLNLILGSKMARTATLDLGPDVGTIDYISTYCGWQFVPKGLDGADFCPLDKSPHDPFDEARDNVIRNYFSEYFDQIKQKPL